MQDIDFTHLFSSPEGRINRQRWWIGVGILFVVGIISSVLFGSGGLVPFIIGILVMLAGIMLHIKRCHDRDKSGWWCLLLLIPFVGTIWAVIDLGILAGTPGENRFGPDPLQG
ncbi:MAG: DUF805 domain-containing protein [Rhizobiales bacterium]|nr:DUF805 domain-containing protein [Hyphomicrobiales bacterium]